MKKLNPSYFEFFFFRYGIIIILALSFLLPIFYLKDEEKDYILLLCLAVMPFLFFVPVSFLDYKSLKKTINPAQVFLTEDGLIINGVAYRSEQIEAITLMLVSNTQDKSKIDYFEIKTKDETVFYFIDRPSNWKFESPTMKLLNKHPVFASKTKEKMQSSAGFNDFKKP